jgi:hypothetical protein
MSIRLLAACLLALAFAPNASAGSAMFVGAAEDQVRSVDPVVAKARMDLAALAGFDAVRMTTIWSPGQREVTGDDLVVLQNAATAAQLDGIRLIVSVYHHDHRTTPLTARARRDFASFTASIARKVPTIADFIVGNEPNLNLFWMPQFSPRGQDAAAVAYEALLAQTYDALKRVSPDVNVIGGGLAPRGQDEPLALRQTHSPTAFIPHLGAAYKQSGRKKRIMDMFALHPYAVASRLAPTFANPRNTSIGVADYEKLRKLLGRAFGGTPQPGAGLPILYDEFGYQSTIPAAKRRVYRNLGSPAARDAIPEARQAAYYRQAFALAQCQPTVAGMLIFHVADERDGNAWQSGVYYADNTPKSSLAAVRSAALRAQAGSLVQCARGKVRTGLGDVVFHEPSVDAPAALGIDFSCNFICRYQARVVRVETGTVALETSGTAAVGDQAVTLSAEELEPGTYQYAFRASAAGRPGTAVTRYSRPFTVPGADVAEPQQLRVFPTLEPTVPAASARG